MSYRLKRYRVEELQVKRVRCVGEYTIPLKEYRFKEYTAGECTCSYAGRRSGTPPDLKAYLVHRVHGVRAQAGEVSAGRSGMPV